MSDTSPSIVLVNSLALKLMKKDFHYNGVTYNMVELGYKLTYHNKKRALGTYLCIY